MERNHRNLTVTIPKEIYHLVQDYKKKHFISISAVVSQLISKWVKSKGEKIND